MPKVITLEKAADGSYEAPKNPIVEEIEAEKSYNGELFEKTVIIKPENRKRKSRNAHEFIVRHGGNASEFLYGVNRTIQVFQLLKKYIK